MSAMSVKRDRHGRMVFSCTTPSLRARIVDGVVETWEVREPILSDAERATVEQRRTICAGCDQNKGLTKLNVKCEGCRCSGVPLLTGKCKLGKWPV